MNLAILIFFFALSATSGFSIGRIDSSKESDAPLFTIKETFEVLQLFLMNDPDHQRQLLDYKNNAIIKKSDLTTRDYFTTEAPIRLTLLEEMLNMTATEIISQANSGEMEKIIQRFQKAWGNGTFLDNYLLKFRSFPGVSPSDAELKISIAMRSAAKRASSRSYRSYIRPTSISPGCALRRNAYRKE